MWMRAPAGSADRPVTAPLMPRNIGQLAWLGIDADSVRRLAPYVVILPVRTAVNLNTASREVIAASIDGLDVGGAERLVQTRQRTPFKTLAEAQALLPATLKMEESRVGVLSNFFEVRGRLRLDDRVMEELSLVERRGLDVVALQRRRVSSKDGAR
jgi:general secretion pathway protein K